MSLKRFDIRSCRGRITPINAVYFVFLFVLLFTPLAFGSVEPWSLLIVETLSVAILFSYPAWGKDIGAYYKTPGMVPLLCIVLYHLLQIVPLPSGLLKQISPSTYEIYGLTGDIVKPSAWISLSVHKKASVEELFRLSAYAAFYIATVQLLTRKTLLKRTIIILTTFWGFLAFLALMTYFFYNGRIYWLRTLTLGGSPFGPFVNRNHYAGFMGMAFPVVLGLFLYYKPHVSYSSLREKIVGLFERKTTNTYILAGLAAVMMAVSVFFSLSRTGIVSLCLSVIFFGIMLRLRKSGSRRGIIVVTTCLLILFSVTWIGWGPIMSRFEKTIGQSGSISEMRPVIWRDTLSVISDFPLFGTGFGTYMDVFPKYNSLPGDTIIDHAHNDYLELATEGGIAGFLLYASFVGAVIISSFRALRKRKELYSFYLYVGSLSGVVYMLFHSISDFNLHIGSNGLYFFFLVGVMVSSANTRLRDNLAPTLLTPAERPRPLIMMIPAFIVLTACLFFGLGGFVGRYYYSSVKVIDISLLDEELHFNLVRDIQQRAVFFDPLTSQNRLLLAEIESVRSGPKEAIPIFSDAVRMNPLNGGHVQRLGLAYSESGDIEKSERLLKTGILLDRMGASVYKTYAEWLFNNDRKDEGIANVKAALAMNPSRTREFIILMVRKKMTKQEIATSMPDRVDPHLVFGRHLAQVGYDDMADDEYRKAFDFIGNEKQVTEGQFFIAAGHFMKKKMYDDAVAIFKKGVQAVPNSVEIRLSLGDVYLKMEMGHMAAREYEKALLIDPGNLKARGKVYEAKAGSMRQSGVDESGETLK